MYACRNKQKKGHWKIFFLSCLQPLLVHETTNLSSSSHRCFWSQVWVCDSFLSRTSLFGLFGTTPSPQTYVDVDRAPTPTTGMSLAIASGPWPPHGREQVYLHGWAYIYTTRVTVVFTSTSPGARSFCSGVESATNCKYLVEIIDFWRRIWFRMPNQTYTKTNVNYRFLMIWYFGNMNGNNIENLG